MPKKRLNQPEHPRFVEFWRGDGIHAGWLSISNPNDGRGDASDAFNNHIAAGADPQDMIDGARWYIRQAIEEKRERQYVPHCQTWLNRRAYADGAEMWRNYQARISALSAAASEGQSPAAKPVKSKWLQRYEAEQAAKSGAVH